jgi:hypothetical protein
LGDTCRRRIQNEEIPTSFPAIASFVTAYGRELMRELREIAGATHVHYQAVDAVYVDDTGLARLQAAGKIGEKELGKLELVGSYESAEFRGINNYSVGSKHVRGSVKASAKQIGPNTFEEPHFQHLASILAEPLQGGVMIKQRIKTMAGLYNRRTIQPTALTSPLWLDEGVTPCQIPGAELQSLAPKD